jgi:beta-aspartyl-dipeptidase (metallo-type)
MGGQQLFKLLKGGKCFNPLNMGQKDILLVCGAICKIEDEINVDALWDVEVINCAGKIVCPGFLDQHVHITGGGGEQGPASRIPELMLSDLVLAGITTVVGVLGVDGITRNIAGLLSKARALESEGVTTYIYTGSYGVPTATLTGKPVSDLALIDKVIGIGEVAIADYRSSYPPTQLLKELSSEAVTGGMLGAKAGIVHIHVGDGKAGISQLLELIEECDFPINMFVPTHLNRNKVLFGQAKRFARMGGYIDLTAGEKTGKGFSVPDALKTLLDDGINMDNVTVSSDGNGSMPDEGNGAGVGKVKQLFDDIRSSIVDKGIGLDIALKTVTSNVAKVLKIYPVKGSLSIGSDADILVLNEDDLTLHAVIAKGEKLVDNGKVMKKGKYEEV